jgi:hypothetical protein
MGTTLERPRAASTRTLEPLAKATSSRLRITFEPAMKTP